VLALGLAACSDRDADVPVVVVFPANGVPGATDVMLGVQSLRISVRKGTPGSADMTLLSQKVYPADATKVSIKGLNGGRDRFVVLEGLDKTPDQLSGGEIPVVLARGSTIPDDYLPGGAEPPASGEYDTVYLFFGRVGEMSPVSGQLHTSRAFFGGAELPNGNIAVAGGVRLDPFGKLVSISTVEVFRRDEGIDFNESGPMTSARGWPSMSAISGRGALIAGGIGVLGTSDVIATAERLDEDGTPVSEELLMGSPRVHLSAVSIDGPNGESQVAVAGGASSFDVTTAKRQVERWDGSQFVPYQPLLIARAGFASATLLDGRALLTGGFSLEPFGAGVIPKVSDSAERLDASDPQPYDLITGMRPHWEHTATRLKFGDVLVAGGSSLSPDAFGVAVATSSADLYLPEFAGFTSQFPLATSRAHHAAAPLADGRALVCGGAPIAGARPGSGVEPIGGCEIFGPSSDATGLEWTAGPSLLVPRYGHAMFGLPAGSVLVVGGVGPGDSFEQTGTAEIYTPTWPEPQ